MNRRLLETLHCEGRTIDGLLDAVERLNSTIERVEKERDDYRALAGEDTSSSLLEAEAERDRLLQAIEGEIERLRKEVESERLITPAAKLVDGWADSLTAILNQHRAGRA